MEELELFCFKLISAAGTARSCNIEAIKEAKKGNFKKAEELMKEGKKNYLSAHEVHNELLKLKSDKEENSSLTLVMHAEDQLMSAEMLAILSEEFISTYKKLFHLENK
ncbi:MULTISPECIES: PTS lactose/cellobiose transporter subunit IIA [Clostridium]|uniref:PTS lactose/cellobiose transporter subunit IIA n=1 Tax=Clostridium TaxID=1485 RepID=UPI00069F0085|nr:MULTISPECIES: PTS lactose/cellobiose transporter subunit IIA [Clostridium]KOF56475.1 PTS cellobiose transporter subunit IIA [Clostridium sp. DMHC 10]MCD2346947.1 PTS lactose/cellobiose transporter subunit IIA [Clostridium guangxiense]